MIEAAVVSASVPTAMEAENSQASSNLRGLLSEVLTAAAALSRWSLLLNEHPAGAEERARALVLFPLIGFAAGVAFAFADRALAGLLAITTRSLAVIALIAFVSGGIDVLGVADMVDAFRLGPRPAPTGLARIGPLGGLSALTWFAASVFLLARISSPEGRTGALVMAAMLSRWSMVPLGYGLKPLERWGLGLPYEGGIKFREFAVSSAVALGLAMGLYENLGLIVVVALAALILGLRLALSRRLGGAAGYTLAGGAALCELAVFAVLAALRA